MKRIAVVFGLVAASTVALGVAKGPPGIARGSEPDRAIPITAARDTVTQVSMRNVNFYVIPDAALRIRKLRGEMRAIHGGPVVFDDKRSFVIRLLYAEIGLNGDDITMLMNKHIFAYRGAPLKKLRVRTSGSQLVQSGIMHKVVDIPFEITADVSVTPAGLIRLHPVKTSILGVDGDGLMRAFGLSLQKILDLRRAKGVTVKGNDLFLDPTLILPPPAIEGHATAIRVEGNELVQTFGTIDAAPPLIPPDTTAPAYMFYKGGTLHFGKLMMLDADMQIVDRQPTGFFDFNLDRYQEQLVAGYSRTLPDQGLEVYMLGLDKLGARRKTLTANNPGPAN
ncbi:MAG TPA: hypothetical protein VK494_08555 [Gemmatimonadaceae bacterium]|nr:hypothetical protein [Gemmatimonadaceae bacterium]